MRRYVEMHQSSTIMLDHDEDIQNLEECCRNREEVDGNQLFRVVLQERPPGLRWRLRMPDQVFANRGFRNLDSQLEKFAMDSGCFPAHIISTQSPNEVARFFRDTWPPRLSMANLPGPVPTEPRRCQSITVSGFTIQS